MTFAPNRMQQNRAPKIKFLFALPISKKSGYLHRMRSANLPFFCGFYSVAIRAFFSLFGLWETLGGLGSFWSIKINLGRLWETLGDSGGAFGEALGGFGELWETLGESLGSLWEALGSFGEVFKAFLLLTPSFPPLYIKKNQTPDQPL